MLRIFTAFILSLAIVSSAFAQSTAINGTIEGTVKDEQGAVLPGVTVTVTNIDTGEQRVVVTNDSGLYRAPLLSLGTYRVSAELQGFKKFEQTGVSLSRRADGGDRRQRSRVGAVAETITVTADCAARRPRQDRAGPHAERSGDQDAAADVAQPLQLRAAAAGRGRLRDQRVRRAAPHRQRRAAARQLPGGRQQQHAEGSRRPAPDADVGSDDPRSEGRDQRLRAGVRPDDGPGLQRDHAVGHEPLKGQGSYRMQRQPMVALPFFTLRRRRPKPPTDVNVYTFDLGGPIVSDKTHFFGGYEHTERDLSGLSVITITPANQAALGLTEPAYMPRGLNTEFAIGKVDHQFSAGNRLSFRYMFFDNFITANVGGGIVSVQRANDFADRQHSTGAQLISTLGATTLNELRVQYATRAQSRVPNALSGTGPAINITGVAQLRRSGRGDRRLGIRLHAERAAGQRQHDVPARATTRSRPASTCSGWPTRARRRRRSSTRSRTSRRTWPRATARTARLHELHAVLRPARSRVQHRRSTGCSSRTTGA